MSGLIDRDLALQGARKIKSCENKDIKVVSETYLKLLPFVDAVRVVRCGECVQYLNTNCPMYHAHKNGDCNRDDYCSYGKKKGEDG